MHPSDVIQDILSRTVVNITLRLFFLLRVVGFNGTALVQAQEPTLDGSFNKEFLLGAPSGAYDLGSSVCVVQDGSTNANYSPIAVMMFDPISKKMSGTFEKYIDLDPSKSGTITFEGMLSLNGQPCIVINQHLRKEKVFVLMIAAYDPVGHMLKEKPQEFGRIPYVGSIPTDQVHIGLEFYSSPDGEKVLVVEDNARDKEDADQVISVFVLGSDLHTQWSNTFKFPNLQRRTHGIGEVLGNDGTVYIVMSPREARRAVVRGEQEYEHDLYRLSSAGMDHVRIDLPGGQVAQTGTPFLTKEGIACIGFCVSTTDGGDVTTGYYVARFNGSLVPIGPVHTAPLRKATDDPIDFTELIKRPEGGCFLVGRERQPAGMKDVYYADMVVISTNDVDELEWEVGIDKVVASALQRNDFNCTISSGHLLIVFRDLEKNVEARMKGGELKTPRINADECTMFADMDGKGQLKMRQLKNGKWDFHHSVTQKDGHFFGWGYKESDKGFVSGFMQVGLERATH